MTNDYIVAKLNANFPGNPKKYALPTIQGVLTVFDGTNGKLLALMDSIEITVIRTGAATGVAAKYLARKNAESITICGCGPQGLISLKAILSVRALKRIWLFDINPGQRKKMFKQASSLFANLEITETDDLKEAMKASDIVVTCTTSTTPIVDVDDVRPGTFIAAVGADNGLKNEIHPRLIAGAKVITDLIEQSVTIGDVKHAIEQGYITRHHIHAELGGVVAGQKTGRANDDEIIVFDSTGIALQDVAAASIVYERALTKKIGDYFSFFT